MHLFFHFIVMKFKQRDYSPNRCTERRDCFNLDRSFLLAILFLRELMVGLVCRRVLAGSAAVSNNPANLLIASRRFISWDRKRLALIINTPLPVMRFPATSISRSRRRPGIDRELFTSKRSWTAVATLLTCCPPGPGARVYIKWISFSSIGRGCFGR